MNIPQPANTLGRQPEPELLVEEQGRVLVLTLNRPQARNAITLNMAARLAEALDTLDQRDDLSLAVLTGTGAAFCAGMDLKGFARGEVPVIPGRGFAGLTESRPTKPLIAAVNGAAVAGGFELVLSCDLIVAAASSVFGLPEVKRGLTAAAGGLLRLRERLPYHAAMELILTGDVLTANQALAYGLANQVVPENEVMTAALELAERIVHNAPLSLITSKRVFIESSDWPEAEQFVRQEELVGPIRRSADAKEGALAFTEKRHPVWTGR